MISVRALALAACALFPAAFAGADNVKLKLLPTGGMPKMGGYMPQRLELSATKPDSVKKMPSDVSAPLFGVLKMGPKKSPGSFVVVVDEPDGRDARLFVDTNGNGDLTDDAAPTWNKRPYGGNSPYSQYMGGANVELTLGGKATPVHLGMYRFDKSDTNRAALKNMLLYYADYAYEGEASLGGASYKVLLADRAASGDFKSAGVTFFIDVNANGRFDARGEAYDASKPFNIKGTTYELTNVENPDKLINIVKSTQTVAEILPPPDLSPGKSAIPFKMATLDGSQVSFPETYKGKVVMLDFWATWCGPCIAELPNLIANYEKYHSRGFEVLGISLDQANNTDKVKSFCSEKKMPWRQVYDGKFWSAEVAQLYVIQAIPAGILVDGDTGKIIASSGLRGETLGPAIEKALAAKGK